MFVRMLHHCGMPVDDVDLIHGNGKVVGEILKTANVRSTLFTGSAKVAETLAVQLRGKVCGTLICTLTLDSSLLPLDTHKLSTACPCLLLLITSGTVVTKCQYACGHLPFYTCTG